MPLHDARGNVVPIPLGSARSPALAEVHDRQEGQCDRESNERSTDETRLVSDRQPWRYPVSLNKSQ